MTRIIVTAIPQLRSDYEAYLRSKLPHAEWVYDQRRNAMDTFLRAIAHGAGDPCLHMEDDVILTKGFLSRVEGEIAARPRDVIQFFSMRGADRTIGSRWDRNFIALLCWYLPGGMSTRLLAYYPEWVKIWQAREPLKREPKTWQIGSDILLRDFLRLEKRRYWIVCPNLVDHRIGKSAIDPRRSSTTRVSRTFTNPDE